VRSRKDRSSDFALPKDLRMVKCESCGRVGASEDLVDAEPGGHFTLGKSVNVQTYSPLNCPRCGTKLGEVSYTEYVETGRTDVSSERAGDVTCRNYG